MEKRVLAFDFGASSGRAMLGVFDGSKIKLEEVHRFDNNPVMLRGTFYWDVLALFHEIKQGILKAKEKGEFSSIGCDTWGVDFGLLDKKGNLLQNPVCYRDARTAGILDKVFAKVDKNWLYNETGNQFMEINTLFQLCALAEKDPELLSRADCALMMPDLLGYFLSGKKASEYAIASTTQMLNPHTGKWNEAVLEKLGLPSNLFPPVSDSGKPLGKLSPDLSTELGVDFPVDIMSITGHDTACAVLAAPSEDKDFIYISCGTWSLFGTELDAPVLTEKSVAHNLTNEGGYGKTTRFLKNIIGLWLIQETRRQYAREGRQYSYNGLEKAALAEEPFQFFIDPDAPEFVAPGDLPNRIRAYCKKTGQSEPHAVGEIMRCIYESLAMKYRYAFEQIQDCTGKEYRHIHMLGGGTKDNLLCAMTAAATGCTVMAGPIEATALGNVAVQLLASGDIPDAKAAREIIARSVTPITYQPENTSAWDAAYKRFCEIIES